jgi:hypothetical protein
MNRMLSSAAALVLASAAGAAIAEEAPSTNMFAPENFTANTTLTSDYRFRGISNSDGIAMQGGFDWAFQGFSAGVWGSNTEFSDSNIEVDIYAGYGWTLSGVDMHVNLLYYMFPGESSRETEGLDPPGFDPSTGLRPGDAGTGFPVPPPGQEQPYLGQFPNIDANYFEANFGVAKSFENLMLKPTIGFDYNYSPDYFGEDGDGHHVQFSLGAVLPYDIGFAFNVGYQDVEGDEFSAYFATPDGYDWWWFSVGVSKEALGFVFDVSYYWVDNGDQCGNTGGVACKWNGGMATFYNDYAYSAEGGTSYRDLTRDEVVFSISRSF